MMAFLQLIYGKESATHPLVLLLGEHFTFGTVSLAVVTATVLAPLTEELLFRGVLQGSLERLTETEDGLETDWCAKPGPARKALPNVLTSFLFASLHAAQWPAPIPLFLLSLVLGRLRRQTGSLWAPIALHAGFNAISTVLLVLGLAAGVLP